MKQRRPRVARMFGCDHNPLRRPIDRLESAITASLVVAFLIAAPLLGIFAGRLADTAGLREQRSESGWKQVTATLTQSAAAGAVGVDGNWDAAWVTAKWRAPSGVKRLGLVATSLNAHAGDRVSVWVTHAGRLTHERLTSAGVRDRIVIAVLTATACLAVLLWLIGGCVRMAANRRRMAGWARGWEQIGPRWSKLR